MTPHKYGLVQQVVFSVLQMLQAVMLRETHLTNIMVKDTFTLMLPINIV